MILAFFAICRSVAPPGYAYAKHPVFHVVRPAWFDGRNVRFSVVGILAASLTGARALLPCGLKRHTWRGQNPIIIETWARARQ